MIQDIGASLENWGVLEEFYEATLLDDARTRLFSGLFGWHWQDRFAAMCHSRGLDPVPAPSKTLPYDFVVGGKKAQCKATSYTDVVDTRSHAKHRCYFVGDFDIFCLKVIGVANEVYFIPATLLADPKRPDQMVGRIKLSSYSRFRNCWEMFGASTQLAV